jgi:hypothetical protein
MMNEKPASRMAPKRSTYDLSCWPHCIYDTSPLEIPKKVTTSKPSHTGITGGTN